MLPELNFTRKLLNSSMTHQRQKPVKVKIKTPTSDMQNSRKLFLSPANPSIDRQNQLQSPSQLMQVDVCQHYFRQVQQKKPVKLFHKNRSLPYIEGVNQISSNHTSIHDITFALIQPDQNTEQQLKKRNILKMHLQNLQSQHDQQKEKYTKSYKPQSYSIDEGNNHLKLIQGTTVFMEQQDQISKKNANFDTIQFKLNQIKLVGRSSFDATSINQIETPNYESYILAIDDFISYALYISQRKMADECKILFNQLKLNKQIKQLFVSEEGELLEFQKLSQNMKNENIQNMIIIQEMLLQKQQSKDLQKLSIQERQKFFKNSQLMKQIQRFNAKIKELIDQNLKNRNILRMQQKQKLEQLINDQLQSLGHKKNEMKETQLILKKDPQTIINNNNNNNNIIYNINNKADYLRIIQKNQSQ